MLRKHRDVVFDIQLFKGMQYTVQADHSDFYNVRDKKLVEFKKKQVVKFSDGERIHLHVGRKFTGSLTLKANGKVMGRWKPSELDTNSYDDAPETKLAPLMVVMKNTEGSPPPGGGDPLGICENWKLAAIPKAYLESIPIGELQTHGVHEQPHPIVVVVDVNIKDAPSEVAQHFMKGGKSVIAELDTNNVATQNWLYGQLAGSAAYVKDNWSWLRNSINKTADGSFKLVKAKISYASGKARVYFTGYSKINPAFGPGGHGPGNAKIMQIYAGIGNTASSFKSMTKAIAGTLKNNALISFFFSSVLSYAEWQDDIQKDGYDLAAVIVTGLVKALIAVALVAVVVALIVFLIMFIFKAALAAIVIGVISLGLSFVANTAVELADKQLGKIATRNEKNTDGLASVVAPWLRDLGKSIGENWDYLKEKMPKDYKNLNFGK